MNISIGYILLGTLVIVLLFVLVLILIIILQSVSREKMILSFREALLKSKVQVQEKAFNNISAEIHDNIGQLLVLTKLQVGRLINEDSDEKAKVVEINNSLGMAISDLRNLAKTLSSERITLKGLIQTIEEEISRINRSGIIKTVFSVEGNVRKMEDQKELILFRIFQECIQNIIKHSQSVEMRIEFHYLTDKLKINIIDYGKGFDPKIEKKNNNGLGLRNITQRSKLIGGSANIESIIGHGSKVEVSLPY